MDIVSARDIGDLRPQRQLLDQSELLGRCPSPSPLRARKNRNRHLICPLACKLMSKLTRAMGSLECGRYRKVTFLDADRKEKMIAA
jgi:hypothetical protein